MLNTVNGNLVESLIQPVAGHSSVWNCWFCDLIQVRKGGHEGHEIWAFPFPQSSKDVFRKTVELITQ